MVILSMIINSIKFYPKETQIRHFWLKVEGFLFFYKTLKIGKFEGGDFKYDNSFLRFYQKDTQMSYFWYQI